MSLIGPDWRARSSCICVNVTFIVNAASVSGSAHSGCQPASCVQAIDVSTQTNRLWLAL